MGRLELTVSQRDFIIKNYNDMDSEDIVKKLGLKSSRQLHTIIYRLRKYHKELIPVYKKKMVKTFEKKSIKENPNPPTQTTEMLICRYHYNGENINAIAHILHRQ